MTRPTTLYLQRADGAAEEVASKWGICPCCSGAGRSAAHLGAFTQDQMDEDPEFLEAYRNGEHDRPCDDCGGAGKVKVPDYARMGKADAAAFKARVADDLELDAILRSETNAEAGFGDFPAFGRG